MLEINERQLNDVTILDLAGNMIMGGGSNKFGSEIRRLIENGKTKILLNFSGVKYIDSSGVGELLASSSALNGAGGSLKLTNLPKKVEDVIALSNVFPILDIYDDEREALDN
jgi:anti-anti-sigma factor